MSIAPPIIVTSLADARARFAAAQAEQLTLQSDIASENESYDSTINSLNAQLGTLNAQIIYFGQQATSGTQMSEEAAAEALAGAQSSQATVKVSIASTTATHDATIASYNAQVSALNSQIQFLGDQIAQILTGISVVISPRPSLVPGSDDADFSAEITGDETGAGVEWTVICNGNVTVNGPGSLSNSSGSSTTYTAPAAISRPANDPNLAAYGISVVLTCRSVTNPNAFDTVQFVIPAVYGS